MFVKLDGKGALNQRLYRGLRRAILDGRLPPGTRLPSTRELAVDLGLSRNVAVLAFRQLLNEGYVDARTGSGTYVCRTVPDTVLMPWTTRNGSTAAPRRPVLSPRATEVLALAPLPAPGRPVRPGLRYDFRYGVPALSDFPHQEWSRIMARCARSISLRMLRYGHTLGYGPLRKAIAGYVARARGVATTADQVVIVNGAQQGLDLIARLLIAPGDRVVVEEPGYQAARLVFQAGHASLLPVPVDEKGIDTSLLPRGVEVRLAYVTPSHQFPLGGVLPLPRRLELLQWAEQSGAYIVEDDYDSEFRYDGRPVEAIQGLDRTGCVLYVGTFSKVLFPSLRIGYLIVPASLTSVIASLRFLTDYHTPTFEQAVLTDFISEGHFERHLRRSRERNKARRAALLHALRTELGDSVEIAGASAGVHLVVWLRGLASARLDAIVAQAAARGLGIYSVAPYYLRRPRRAGLLLGYANLRERDIREGIALLAGVVRDDRKEHGEIHPDSN
jgi:GntR family transcriptional regulator/MocR family aminotransferase